MTVSLQKLRALRREVSSASVPPPATAGEDRGAASADRRDVGDLLPAPRNLQSQQTTKPAAQSIEALRRLLGVRARNVVPLLPRCREARMLHGFEFAPGLRQVKANLTMAKPATALSLGFATGATPTRQRSGLPGRAQPAAVDPRELLFFATETTGLAGGTGTRA